MTYQLPQSVIDKIKNDLPKKPIPKELFYLKNVFTIISVIFLFTISFAAIAWLFQQARIFYVFWPFIGNSWYGWIWVFIPEFVIFVLLSSITTFVLYKATDWFGVKYSDFIVIFGVLISLLINVPINTYALDKISFIKQIHTNFLTSPYRIKLRDLHIVDLENKKEFYGFVTSADEGSITINHGGILLNFVYYGQMNTSVGQRIWVKFNNANDTREIVEYKLFD